MVDDHTSQHGRCFQHDVGFRGTGKNSRPIPSVVWLCTAQGHTMFSYGVLWQLKLTH